jgi:hypothetical protein
MGALTGTPAVGDVGTAHVRVKVVNQFGGQAEEHFDLTVAR